MDIQTNKQTNKQDVLDKFRIGEQLINVVEQDKQHSVTNVHRGTEHNANVLQIHLVR